MKKLFIIAIIGIFLLSACSEAAEENMPEPEAAPPLTSPDITTTEPKTTDIPIVTDVPEIADSPVIADSPTIADAPAVTTAPIATTAPPSATTTTAPNDTITSTSATTSQATTTTTIATTTPTVTTAPPIIEAPSNTFALPYGFTATDLYGNAVTEKTLGEKQVYLVHLWATWCGPCVRGMPDMAKIARDYGDDVGFIGLVVDFDNASGAIKIIESAGMPSSFIMIDAYEPSAKALLDIVSTGFVPSSAYITKDCSSQLITGGKYAETFNAILD